MSARVPDAVYSKLAIECTSALLTAIDVKVISEVGWHQLIADVFDLTDALVAEMEKRLEARQWPEQKPGEQP